MFANKTAFSTHRPRETEGQHNPGFIVRVVEVLDRKSIPTDNGSRSASVTARASRRHPRLILLQTHAEKRIALVRRACAVQRDARAVTARAALQLPVHVLHGQNLHLKMPRCLTYLEQKYAKQFISVNIFDMWIKSIYLSIIYT